MNIFNRFILSLAVILLASCDSGNNAGYPGVTVKVIGDKPYVEMQGDKHSGKIQITALRDIDITDIELGSIKNPPKMLLKKEWVITFSDNPGAIVLERGDTATINFTVDVGDVDRLYGIVMKVDGEPYSRYFDLSKIHYDDMTKGVRLIRIDKIKAADNAETSPLLESKISIKDTQLLQKKSSVKLTTKKTVRISASFNYLFPNSPPTYKDDPGLGDSNWDPDRNNAQIKNADTLKYTIYDSDVTLDKVLKTGFTDSNGIVDTSIVWTDCAVCDVPDIYIEFETINSAVEVESATLEINYRYKTDIKKNYRGSSLDFGSIVPLKHNRPILIHSIITKANRTINNDLDSFYKANNSDSIIDSFLRYFLPDKRVPLVDVQYPSAIVSASYYWGFLKEIHLKADDVWGRQLNSREKNRPGSTGAETRVGGVLLHEYGHHVLRSTAKIYKNNFTPHDYCNGYADDGTLIFCGHTTWCQESGYAAWLEGYGDFIQYALSRRLSDIYGFPYFDPIGDILSKDNSIVTSNEYITKMYHEYENVQSCPTKKITNPFPDEKIEPSRTEGFITAFMVDLIDKSFDIDSMALQVNFDNHYKDIYIRDRDNAGLLRPEKKYYENLVEIIPSPYAPTDYYEMSDGDSYIDKTEFNYIDLINVPMKYEVRSPEDFVKKLRQVIFTDKNDVWETAYNVDLFFANILDRGAPRAITNLKSSTHSVDTATAYPFPEFTWSEAFDDSSGIGGYSVSITLDNPSLPDKTKDIGNVEQYVHAAQLSTGTYFFNIRAVDRSGKWSGAYESFGPFIITESSFILDEEALLQGLTGKTIFGDYNNDGLLDILNINDSGVASLRAGEVGGYSTNSILLPQGIAGNASAVLIDFDNDSYDDVFMAYCDSNSKLLKNNGDDTFTEIPLDLNIGCPKLTIVDANNDGLLDVYAVQKPSAFTAKAVHLVLENTEGIFTVKPVTFADDFGEALTRVTWQDIDGDGKPEFICEYASLKEAIPGVFYEVGGNRIYELILNASGYQAVRREIIARRITRYTEPTILIPSFPIYEDITAAEIEGYPLSAWGDFDNDGDLDLALVVNNDVTLLEYESGRLVDHNSLNGSARFINTIAASPIAVSWVDIDNDTDLDLHIAGKNKTSILVNNNGVFSDATLDLWPLATTPYGIWSDYDLDGDLDYITSAGVYANNMNTVPNKWLTVKLVGKISNIRAIGATIKLREKSSVQIRTVDSTSSPLPVNPGLVTFGLGKIERGYSIDVTWPSGDKGSYSASIGVANQIVTLTESFYDPDGDDIDSKYDNCPDTANKEQKDFNANGVGDACDDTDQDEIFDRFDNCRTTANTDQADFDRNEIGDACDDFDEDGVLDFSDNCQTVVNTDQLDTDNDQIGDVCDLLVDSDNDSMDDAWELANFSSLNIADESTDADNDGYLDTIEFANETDPVSYASAPGPVVIYVDKNTANVIQTGAVDSPYGTIEEAVTTLKSGDTINIAAGIYEESIVIAGDNVTIQGDGEVTIKSPTNSVNKTVLKIINSYHVAVSNITLNGEGSVKNNVLMYLGNVSDVLLSNIKIINANVETGRVAGIYIADNSDDITIIRSLFSSNSSDVASAIYMEAMGNVTVQNCVFYANVSRSDGATITLDNGAIAIRNSIFYKNDNDISVASTASSSVSYSMFDTENSYTLLSGNIIDNPDFVNVSSQNYHLSKCSPAIDAGDPLSDVGKEPVPNGNIVNMGLYGGTGQASFTSVEEKCAEPDKPEEPAAEPDTSTGSGGGSGSLAVSWVLFMFLVLLCRQNIRRYHGWGE